MLLDEYRTNLLRVAAIIHSCAYCALNAVRFCRGWSQLAKSTYELPFVVISKEIFFRFCPGIGGRGDEAIIFFTMSLDCSISKV